MEDELSINQLLTLHHEQTQTTLRQNAAAFQGITQQLSQVSGALFANGALNSLPSLNNPDKILGWTQEIDKCRVIHRLSNKDTCQLAWAKSTGVVSQQIGRHLEANPDLEWSTLKRTLEQEYGHVVDQQMAFVELTSLKQNRDEDVASFVERFLAMATKSYGEGRFAQNPLMEEQLVGLFMNGVRSRETKLRLYRQQVKKIEEAIKIAKQEDLTKRRFPQVAVAGDRCEVDMEVNKLRRGGCFNCGGPHKAKECRQLRTSGHRVQTIQSHMPEKHRKQDSNLSPLTGDKRWNAFPNTMESDKRLRRCFRCHQAGHFAAQCAANLNYRGVAGKRQPPMPQ